MEVKEINQKNTDFADALKTLARVKKSSDRRQNNVSPSYPSVPGTSKSSVTWKMPNNKLHN